MAVLEQSIAASTAVLQYNLLQNDPLRQTGYARRIIKVGLAGSAAALDTRVSIMVGATKVATLFNVATGAVLSNAHFRAVDAFIPGDGEVSAIVEDAPATNPVNIVLETEP